MILATAKTADGRRLLLVGLSFANLDKFRAEAGSTFIRIDGAPLGLETDVMIVSGETEAHLAEQLGEFIGPNTKVATDERLKN